MPSARPKSPEPAGRPAFGDAMRAADMRDRGDRGASDRNGPAHDRPADPAATGPDRADANVPAADKQTAPERPDRKPAGEDRIRESSSSDQADAAAQPAAAPAEDAPVKSDAPVRINGAAISNEQNTVVEPVPASAPDGDLVRSENKPVSASNSTLAPGDFTASDQVPKPTTTTGATVTAEVRAQDAPPHHASAPDAEIDTAKARDIVTPTPTANSRPVDAQTLVEPTSTKQAPAMATTPAPAPKPDATADVAARIAHPVVTGPKAGTSATTESPDLAADDPKPTAPAGERTSMAEARPLTALDDDAVIRVPTKPFAASDMAMATRAAADVAARPEPAPAPPIVAFAGDGSLVQLQSVNGLATYTPGVGTVETVSASAAQSTYARGADAAQPPVQQVAIQISRAVQEGSDRVTVQLKPAALGRISIDLEVGHDNRVIAVIAAERSDTMELLQRDAKALERALNDAGLKTDSGSLSFSLKEESGGQAFDGKDAGTNNAAFALPDGTDAALPADEDAPYVRPTGHGAIDIRI